MVRLCTKRPAARRFFLDLYFRALPLWAAGSDFAPGSAVCFFWSLAYARSQTAAWTKTGRLLASVVLDGGNCCDLCSGLFSIPAAVVSIAVFSCIALCPDYTNAHKSVQHHALGGRLVSFFLPHRDFGYSRLWLRITVTLGAGSGFFRAPSEWSCRRR